MRSKLIDWDLCREQFLHRLYRKGPTSDLLREFTRTFYDGIRLPEKKRPRAESIIENFSNQSIQVYYVSLSILYSLSTTLTGFNF